MSAIAKKLRTEKVTIKVGDLDAETFYLQKPVANNLLQLVRSFQLPTKEPDPRMDVADIFPEPKDPNERIASVLRGARYKNGFTQVELARRLKITQGDLSKMEHGKRPIGKRLAIRLAKILDIDYRVFL